MKGGMRPVQVPQFYTDSEKPHLGGYIVGGDDATFYPDLWRWLVEKEGVRSVVDVGCGEGHALRYFRDLGCRVKGIDGVHQDDPDITEHDYTQCPLALFDPWDLVWSCEFVEHVEERFMPNFLSTFHRAPLILMTHAGAGQQGWNHVNSQPPEYWIGVMAAMGYALDYNLTNQTRALASMNTSPYNHFRRSGLAFVRR